MAMDDPFDAFHPLYISREDTHDPNKPCYLFDIPREIRDMIYDCAISSGSLAILQTSRKVHEEGIEFLYKRRVCQINVDNGRYTPQFNLPKPIAALIQNISIIIFLEPPTWSHRFPSGMRPVHKFMGGSIARQTCRVLLFFLVNDDLDPRDSFYYYCFLDPLRTLVGFSRLTLEVRFQGRLNGQDEQILSRFRKVFIEAYCPRLEDWLGHGTLQEGDDQVSVHMEFHPRTHYQANPKELAEWVHIAFDPW